MGWFLKAVFRPSGNKHYISKSAHKNRLIVEAGASLLLFGFLGYLVGSWVGLFIGIVVAVTATVLLDRLWDKIAWPFYESLGYEKHVPNQTEEELLESAKKEAAKKARKNI